MKEIHSKTDIFPMHFWNKEKERQTYKSLGSAFWCVRANGANQINNSALRQRVTMDRLFNAIVPCTSMWGQRIPEGSTEVFPIMPDENR